MQRNPYPTDLSFAEWAAVEPLIPPAKPGGRPRSQNMREILNAIFYVLRAGCAWRLLPHDLPNWSTVYWSFRLFRLYDLLTSRTTTAEPVGHLAAYVLAHSVAVATATALSLAPGALAICSTGIRPRYVRDVSRSY